MKELLEKINSLPKYQRLIAGILIIVLILGLFIWLSYLPNKNKITLLQNEIAKIQNEININMTKARRLEELKKENKELERQLTLKKYQLPPEAEVESLLKQVSELGLGVGLDFKLWRPSPKIANPSGLYIEIPVDIEIVGYYHTVATFFDRVGKLSRIVNIKNIQMSNPRIVNDRVMLQTRFVATAFAAVEEPVKEQ
jgi:type IV pilus assembly protein PilO